MAIKPLSAYFPNRSYGIVVRKGRFLSPQAKRFINMIDPEFFRKTGGIPGRAQVIAGIEHTILFGEMFFYSASDSGVDFPV